MCVQLRQALSGLVPKHDDTGSFLGGFDNCTGVAAGMIGSAHERKLPSRLSQARIGGNEIELALRLVDPGDRQGVAVGGEAASLQECG